MLFSKEKFVLHALRGATTCENNSIDSIKKEVDKLIDELMKRNDLVPDQIVSITFSVTTDLDACFPAAVARKRRGWEKVALLDCQQMFVKGDLKKCIRLMAHVWLPQEKSPQHPYMRKAKDLRPDRSKS